MTLVAFIIGFWTCGIVLGTMWLLRERERARVFKGLRQDNERLRATDRERRGTLEYIYSNLQEFNLKLGGLASLPGSAERGRQQNAKSVDKDNSGPFDRRSHFKQG
jgi:hypothetical protein